MTVGPLALGAVENAAGVSSRVRAATAAQPNPFAVETTSRAGRSSPGTSGVFSRTANFFSIAYSPLQGTISIALRSCCAAEASHLHGVLQRAVTNHGHDRPPVRDFFCAKAIPTAAGAFQSSPPQAKV
jgi:hypothetical protein